MSSVNPGGESCFVDSNVWLYAFIAGQDANRSSIASNLIKRNEIVVSVQVINEVCVNLIKKGAFDEPAIQTLIDSFYSRYSVVETSREQLIKASHLRSRYHLSYWDSLIVAAALVQGATILYSEDMHHGSNIEGKLKIVNPFIP